MQLPVRGEQTMADGRLADAIKRVPAVPPEPLPDVPKLIDVVVDDFVTGDGHDTDLSHHLG